MLANGKGEKFRKIAQRRVSNILKQVRLVGNLSNRNAYEYTPEQTDKMFKVIRAELDAVEERFVHHAKPQVSAFSFE